MKALRHLSALLASCLFAIIAIPLAHAVEEEPSHVPVDWVGNGAEGDDDASNPQNWMGPDEETPYSVAGDGSEDFRFGEYSPGLTNVFVPTILDEGENPLPVAVHDLVFSNTASTAASTSYNFSFTGNDAMSSALFLLGNVSLADNGLATVEDSLAFLLSEGNHTATIGSNAILHVDAPIFEYGEGEGDGTASITKWGAGTLILSSAYSDFTGGVSVYEGKLAIGNSSQEGEEGMSPSGPLGTGTLKLYSGTALGVLEGGSYTLLNTIDLDCSGGSITIDLGSNDSLTLAGEIYGNASLVQNGGTLSLMADNTFTGGVTVESGATLAIGGSSHAEWIPDEVGDGGYYQVTDGPVGTGTLKLDTGSTLAIASGGESEIDLHNDIDLGCFSGNVTINTGCDDLTLLGYIEGTSGILKQGDGTLTLSNGWNDFSGGVTVEEGTLRIGASSREGGMDMFGFSEGGEEGDGPYYESGPLGTGTLKMEAGTTLGIADSGSYLLHNEIDLGCFEGTVTIDTGCGDLTLLGYISGAAGLTKIGSGTLNLEEENEMDGDLVVAEGTVNVNHDWAAGYGALVFDSESGATVNFNTTNPEVYGLAGSGMYDVINLNGVDGPESPELEIYQDRTSTYAGVIQGEGSVYLAGSGKLTLSGQSTYSEGTTVEEGATLVIGASSMNEGSALISGPIGTGALSLNSGSTLSASGGDLTILNEVALGGSLGSEHYFDIGAGNHLTIGDGTLGVISGDGELDKTGAGTLTLKTANTYAGDTVVSGGVLEVTTAGALGSGKVTLDGGALKLSNGITSLPNTIDFGATNGGGTLTGNWVFTTSQTFGSNVTLSPGNSPGTMSFTNLTVNDGLTTVFEFNAATDNPGVSSDLLAGTGTLDLSTVSAGGYTLKLVSLLPDNSPGAVSGLNGPTSWTIFQFAAVNGFLTDNSQFNFDTNDFAGGGIFSLTQVGGDLVLNFTPVPEPSTYALLALGAGLTGFAAWRKRRRA